MVAAVQHDYEVEDRVIRESRHDAHQHHHHLPGVHLPGHQHRTSQPDIQEVH